jgi:glucose-induced degradation protein 8
LKDSFYRSSTDICLLLTLKILDTNPPLLFHLHLQQFIELIRLNQIPEALSFAATELAPRGKANPEFLGELERGLCLLAFPELGDVGRDDWDQADGVGVGNGDWKTLGSLMRKEHRVKVAKELNSAILESQGQGQETKLGGLIRLMSWGEEQLAGKGVHVPGVDVSKVLQG